MESQFEIGQRVRIKEDAFPGSNERVDIAARGATGTLINTIDPESDVWLWEWRNDKDGTVTYPTNDELEAA